jgi:hypothetical protein
MLVRAPLARVFSGVSHVSLRVGSSGSSLVVRPRAALRRARSSKAGAGDAAAPPLAVALTVLGFVPFAWYGAQHASTRSAAGRGAPWGDAALAALPAPLGAAASALFASGSQEGARARFAAYSATILSFVGAVHWGLAAAAPTAFARVQLVSGVLPALVAWSALSCTSGTAQIGLLAGGFVGVHFLDAAAEAARPTAAVPPWYVGLRTPTTSAVLAAHCLAMYACKDPSVSDRQ